MSRLSFELCQLYYVIRIIVAGLCGVLIGFERRNRAKDAGVRTHCVVACGAALMMIISKYGFADSPVGELGMRGADGSRIAAQVVSGIGFLGAGMIFVHKNSITGLTTAAGIWATSGVGMAIGAGMYTIGILSSVIIIVAQVILHKNLRWLRVPVTKTLSIRNVDVDNYREYITERLKTIGVNVGDVSAEKNTGLNTRNYTISIEIPSHVNEDLVLDLITFDCKLKSN